MRRALTILAFATLAGLAGAAEIYKWTDAEGKVHFSDSPPPGVSDAVKVSIASAPTDPARLEHLDQQAEVRAKQSAMEDQLRDSQQKRAGEEAATKQQDCDAARKRYESVQYSRKFASTDKDGKEDWLSGADADKMKADIRAKMDEACGTK